jgi:hypothetical protein
MNATTRETAVAITQTLLLSPDMVEAKHMQHFIIINLKHLY